MMTTLNEDFSGWWNMRKYRDRDIEARTKYGEFEIYERIADSSGKEWPGEEKDVKYFVRLYDEDQEVFVGFREERTETGRRRKYALFPIHVGKQLT